MVVLPHSALAEVSFKRGLWAAPLTLSGGLLHAAKAVEALRCHGVGDLCSAASADNLFSAWERGPLLVVH